MAHGLPGEPGVPTVALTDNEIRRAEDAHASTEAGRAYGDLIAERNKALTVENRELREALVKYGSHLDGVKGPGSACWPVCSCGFEMAKEA